jgi:elongation factor P
MIKAVDLRKGRTILYDGELAVVHEARQVSKGNKRSYVQAKIKTLKKGTIFDVRFNVDERIETPFVDSRDFEFLYRDGSDFVIMDLETFDQINVDADLMGDAAKWLRPNVKVSCQIYDGKVIQVDLPHNVDLEVTEAPPVVKGATATNQLKEVVLETGAKVRVPPFIETGERIVVDTRTGEYHERAM